MEKRSIKHKLMELLILFLHNPMEHEPMEHKLTAHKLTMHKTAQADGAGANEHKRARSNGAANNYYLAPSDGAQSDNRAQAEGAWGSKGQ